MERRRREWEGKAFNFPHVSEYTDRGNVENNLTDEERNNIKSDVKIKAMCFNGDIENGLELKEREEDGKDGKDATANNKNNNNNNNNNNNGNDSIPSKKKHSKATKVDVEYFVRQEKFTSLILAHPQLDPKTTLPQLLEFCAKLNAFHRVEHDPPAFSRCHACFAKKRSCCFNDYL